MALPLAGISDLIGAGRSDLAERELRRHLAGAPEDGAAHALLALALISLRRGPEALAAANQAARLDPDHAWAVQARVEVHVRMGDGARGEAAAREALARFPTEPLFHARLATALLNHRRGGRRRAAEALAAANSGLALDPGHAECMLQRAQALMRLGRWAEARDAADAALRLNPAEAASHAVRGQVAAAAGHYAGADENMRAALRISPHHPAAQRFVDGPNANTRLLAAMVFQMEVWARPLRALLLLALALTPLVVARGWRMPASLGSMFAPIGLGMLLVPGYRMRRHPGLLEWLRGNPALYDDKVEEARWCVALFGGLTMANFLVGLLL